MSPSRLFSEDDRKRISEAVREAESATSGEIVPYVVGRSDAYPETLWRAGALVALLVLFSFATADLVSHAWLPFSITEIALGTVAGFGIGIGLTALFPRIRMWLVTGAIQQQRVQERAALAFLAEEVFNTRERTGIIILVSLLERRVAVLGDSGINSKVEKKVWDEVVDLVIGGMQRKAPADGLINAVRRCGAILEEHGVAIRSDDTNELGDDVRLQER